MRPQRPHKFQEDYCGKKKKCPAVVVNPRRKRNEKKSVKTTLPSRPRKTRKEKRNRSGLAHLVRERGGRTLLRPEKRKRKLHTDPPGYRKLCGLGNEGWGKMWGSSKQRWVCYLSQARDDKKREKGVNHLGKGTSRGGNKEGKKRRKESA